ncbi:MAG TPA: NAD+ synthase [Mycobacteriales bacterium]|jgi:NAD+ synthase (glutamine-hydrolysing)|nr:NAD+ synthase [Mycobacteriales bacterium]
MAQLRIALAQVDTTVGDLGGNADVVVEWSRRAAAAGADLLLFPEMALTGYPPEDLVFRESFRSASVRARDELAGRLEAEGLGDLAVVVGYLDAAGGPRNACALLHGGHVAATYFKHHLPNYGVFDEARYFVPGDRFVVVRVRGVDVGLTVCEDMWQDGGPFAVAGRAEVGLVTVINGSPYERNKDDVRLPLARRRAAEAGATVAYLNMVGAQDELVYDGDSFVVGADGTLLARAPQYEETLLVADLDPPGQPGTVTGPVLGMTVERRVVSEEPAPARPPVTPPVAERMSDEEEVWQALVAGTRDYVRKNGFRSVVLGLSGGIDSAVCAAVAADAIGPDRVFGVSMPSSYSSPHSRDDAAELARRLGCDFRTVPISPMVDAFLAGLRLTGLAEENLQARVRGTTLMGLSNQEGHLVLATGNKTELSVGYSTLYGDSVGGYAPIKDVPKTMVWRLARWRNSAADKRGETAPIPESSISKPPSAELRPGQLDTDSLPPYELLDAVLADYVDRDLGWADLVAAGHDPELVERVIRLVDSAEYKRRQYPPGPKISLKAFGRDRRLPISSRWAETAPPESTPEHDHPAEPGPAGPPGDPVRGS